MTDIRILGGGVSGVTTGIVLRLLGHGVTITAEQRLDQEHRRSADPTFASMFPPASIIPHTLVDHGRWQAEMARRFFGALRSVPGAGVRTQRHLDVFEEPTSPPGYALGLDGFEMLADGACDPGAPRRTGCDGVWGWSFECLFAEMPRYRRWLLDVYAGLGGGFDVPRRVTAEDLPRFAEPVVVNCTGFGSGALFDTLPELTLVKGILVKVLTGGRDCGAADSPSSYSYTPDPSVFAHADGTAANVYFYPRADCWLLGGTRWPGMIDDEGRWTGEGPHGPTTDIDGIEVPAAIVDLNRDLVRTLTGVDVADFEQRAVVGYRCRRAAARGGLRIESEPLGDKLVVHNYAHAGVGVTLSWGSAIRVARMVATASGPPDLHLRDVDPLAVGPLAALVAEALEDAPG